MRKTASLVMALALVLALVGCGNSNSQLPEKKYSFSGENEELQVYQGTAIIGGEEETFNGGKLEIKGEGFSNLTEYTMTFYIPNGEDRHTILSNTVQDTTDVTNLKEEEIGQITGQVLNTDMDESELTDNLYFELITTDESGETKTYTVPMEVKEVTTNK